MSDSAPDLRLRPAVHADLQTVTEIYNKGIRGRTATFETKEREPEELEVWLSLPYPFLVAEADNAVIGWVAGSAYSERDCYRGIMSFSVYVKSGGRGQGVGRALMTALIAASEAAGFHKLTSRIFPENEASLALMASCGFRVVGKHLRHAQLDGFWRDVVVVEKFLGS